MSQTIAVPGVGDLEFPDGMSDADMAAAIQKNYPQIHQQPSSQSSPVVEGAKDFASGLIRPVAKAVAALPLMAMNAGVAGRQMLFPDQANGVDRWHISNDRLPSTQFDELLDAYTRAPQDKTGKLAEGIGTLGAGLAMPNPSQFSNMPKLASLFDKPALDTAAVPKNFSSLSMTDPIKALRLQQASGAGYVVPPATTNPTTLNRALESFGGKIATAQDAAISNQGLTNDLARSALGLDAGEALTPEVLRGVRGAAADAYRSIRGVGRVVPGPEFSDALHSITAPYESAARDFPALARDDITQLVSSLDKPEFDSNSAIDALRMLRGKADAAFRQGDTQMGSAAKSAAKALEDSIERHLKDSGQADLLTDFQKARALIAKSHTVEDVTNVGTGNVSAAKLGGKLNNGEPLSGPLRTAGQFGAAFPKAAREVTDSGSTRNTDVLAGGGATAITHQPWWLLYPFGRMAMRDFLLSPQGQKLATPGLLGPPAGLTRLGPGLMAASQ